MLFQEGERGLGDLEDHSTMVLLAHGLAPWPMPCSTSGANSRDREEESVAT